MRLALLFLASCTTGPVYLLPEPRLYDATEKAADAINAATGEQIFAIGAEPMRTILVMHTSDRCGMFDAKARRVLVGSCGNTETVIVHELGHALGLEHSADPESIMFAIYHQMPLDAAAASLAEELSR